MDLRHLRYFVAVAQELNFGRAAARIGIEQSPLSRAIRELETELGVTLLVRASSRTRLTYAGERVLEDAQRILNAVRQIRLGARSESLRQAQRLRIGISPVLAGPYLSHVFSHMRREQGGVELCVTELCAAQQIAELEAGVMDIALSLREAASRDIPCEVLGTAPLVALLAKTHPDAAGSSLRLEDLSADGCVSGHPEILAGLRRDAKRRSGMWIDVADLTLLVEQAAAGLTVGVALGCQLYRIDRRDLTVIALSDEPLQAYALWSAGGATPALRHFVDLAEAAFAATVASSLPGASA